MKDLSQHMKKRQGHKPACKDIKIIHDDNNWKKRQFKKAARIILHKKSQLMNKKEKRKTISNLWNIILNDNY